MTITREIKSLEKSREELEAEAITTIKTIVRKVEATTGRKLEHHNVEKIRRLPELPIHSVDYLGPWIVTVGRHIKRNWYFNSPCEFFSWAEDYFLKGWENP